MDIISIVKDSFIESAPFNWGISLFCYGCNLQCSFCKGYNYETVTNKKNVIGNVIDILKENVNPCHDCVVFIGGEPTIWGNDLIKALMWCKARRKKTKIFSNGYNYEVIEQINNLQLCDAWSIDYKGIPEHVGSYVGVPAEKYCFNVSKTLMNIIRRNLPLEIRTTYFDGNIDDKDKIREGVKKIESYMKDCQYSAYYRYFEQEDFRKKLNNNINERKEI